MIPLHHPLRHNTDHPAVPSLACQYQGVLLGEVGALLQMRHNRAQDFFLHPLPLAVQAFQPFGNFTRACGVGQSEQVDDIPRVFHAPGGVQARRQSKAHVPGADFFARKARKLNERGQTGLRRLAQTLQAETGDDAVFAEEWDNVRNRPDGDDFQEGLKQSFGHSVV